ncbi:MAG: ABC transporter ATP-binding protein [Patescibacteria group bacterium]
MPRVITVRELSKDFRTLVKEPGLRGSLKAVLRPAHREVAAVRGLSFAVEAGEILACIGPNGAGKSTTIKMLTGILFPTEGTVDVLGFVPWRQRPALNRRIATVFGQRSQLWYHLPPADTFDLLGRIYEMPRADYRARLSALREEFGLVGFWHTPVRKLSLGQRMRCEVAAAFLHRPEVVFLDEPTIGLDVVAKASIREMIRRLNREEGVTVFLTSHDPADIEQLCRRVLVINHGRLILDDGVKGIRRDYLGRKILRLRLDRESDPPALPGVEVLKRKGPGLKLSVDTARVTVDDVLRTLMDRAGILDITVTDPPLEAVIAAIYQERGLPEKEETAVDEDA